VGRVATIGIPYDDWFGSEVITFTATDPGLLSDSDAAILTVTGENDPPIVSDIPNQTIDEGQSFTQIVLDDYVFDVEDPDENIQWTYNGNMDLVVNISNRIATISAPDINWNGFEIITFIAQDTGLLIDSDEAIFTIVAINDPPVVDDISNQIIPEGGFFTSIALDDYVNDIEDSDEDISWTITGNVELNISIDTNRIVSITLPGPEWNGTETITFIANDTGGLTDQDQAIFTVSSVNDPPYAPFDPNPISGTKQTGINVRLRVNVTDIDGDILNVSFYDASDDSLIGFENNVSSGSNASIIWSGLSYEKKYYWYAIANDSELMNISETWNFTTKSKPASGFTNSPPVADASLSDTFGFVGEPLNFDGSQSEDFDGSIVNFTWDFDDGTQGFGKKTTHIFNENGTYQVILTVFDDFGETDEAIVMVEILTGNYPPSKPAVDGPISGMRNITYEFSAISVDQENETIQYVFNWGDGNSTTTEYFPSGNITYQTHFWTHYGEYVVTVQAFDNATGSEIEYHTILIDILPIDDIIKGFLINEDNEETYDIFDNSDTQNKTAVKIENGTYLIDSNGDGKWDYAFNKRKGISTYVNYLYTKYYDKFANDTPGFETLTLLLAIALLCIVTMKKRRKQI
jgi:hypothetical protein